MQRLLAGYRFEYGAVYLDKFQFVALRNLGDLFARFGVEELSLVISFRR